MTDKSVVIVIPIYKDKLSPTEVISLQQLNKILGKYPRVFVAPQSLVFDFGSLGEGIGVERFEDHWFQSVTSYSCLMMQKDFYARFFAYEYMLLHQLDVFVFSDRIKEFCEKDVDYIGAPIGRFAPFWHAIGAQVGNGGFSLRRIPAVMNLLNDFDNIVKDTPFFPFFTLEEDLFFAYCGKREDVDFRTANFSVAQDFSVQEDVGHIYRKIENGWRPFGCHGWPRMNYTFWNALIKEYDYDIPPTDSKEVVYVYGVVKDYIAHRRTFNLQPAWGWLRKGESSKLGLFFENILEKYPDDSIEWKGRLSELTLFWCALIEKVQTQRCHEDKGSEAVLESIYRAMKNEDAEQYLWEVWDMMLPILGREPYPVRDKIIKLVLEKKLEKFVIMEQAKIDKLLREKGQMTERQYNIERQVRMQAGQKLFEKAIEWNISTENELWKKYGVEVIKL